MEADIWALKTLIMDRAEEIIDGNYLISIEMEPLLMYSKPLSNSLARPDHKQK